MYKLNCYSFLRIKNECKYAMTSKNCSMTECKIYIYDVVCPLALISCIWIFIGAMTILIYICT